MPLGPVSTLKDMVPVVMVIGDALATLEYLGRKPGAPGDKLDKPQLPSPPVLVKLCGLASSHDTPRHSGSRHLLSGQAAIKTTASPGMKELAYPMLRAQNPKQKGLSGMTQQFSYLEIH